MDSHNSPQADKPAVRATGQPRYLQVADELRAGIAAGRYCGGDQLPTESALCDTYGVSRFTVREALRRLQAEGLIRRRRGSGTTVNGDGSALRQPMSDVADLLQYAAGSRFAFVVVGPVTLAAGQATDLGVAPGSSWIHLAGERSHDSSGAALALTDVYINAELAGFVAGLRPGKETLFAQLAATAGFRIGRVDQDLRALAAGGREALALGIPRRAPVLRIVRTYRDENDRIVEISVSAHPGDRFTYSMRINDG